MRHTAEAVFDEKRDDVIYLDDLDIESLHSEIRKVNNDPFSKEIPWDSLPKKLKARTRKLAKNQGKETEELLKWGQGTDGAQTKYVDPELVVGYSIFNVVLPPYDVDVLASLYDEHAVLHSVVDARTMNTVGLGFTWQPTIKAQRQMIKAISTSEASGERIRKSLQKERDRMNELLDGFNDEETLIQALIRVWTDVMTTGNGYLEIGRANNGKVGYVGHIPSRLIRVRRNRDGFIQYANQVVVYFRNFGDTDYANPVTEDPNPNEIIHFKLYSPTNNYYGVPPSVSALAAIVGDKFAKEYNIDYFENKAIPRYAIIIKGAKLSQKSKQEIVQYFRNEVKGKNHGTLVIPLPASLSGSGQDVDIKFEKLEDEIQDMSFKNFREQNGEEIVAAYRVPPTKVGIFDNANLAISRDADKTFKTQVCGPDQVSVEHKINKIVQEFTDLYTFELNQLDILDDVVRSQIHDRYMRDEAMTPNEARSQMNPPLPPLPDGDKVLPYPPNAQLTMQENQQRSAENMQQAGFDHAKEMQQKNADAAAEQAKQQAQGPNGARGGAPAGNSNAQSGSPQKSGQDNGKTKTSNDITSSRERGAQQDATGKTRERNQ